MGSMRVVLCGESPSSVACDERGESYLAEARMLIFILCFIRGELCICIVIWVYVIRIRGHWLSLFQTLPRSFLRFLDSVNSFLHRSQMLLDILAAPSVL